MSILRTGHRGAAAVRGEHRRHRRRGAAEQRGGRRPGDEPHGERDCDEAVEEEAEEVNRHEVAEAAEQAQRGAGTRDLSRDERRDAHWGRREDPVDQPGHDGVGGGGAGERGARGGVAVRGDCEGGGDRDADEAQDVTRGERGENIRGNARPERVDEGVCSFGRQNNTAASLAVQGGAAVIHRL